MTIAQISNGEAGLAVRGKLNAVIDATNGLATVVTCASGTGAAAANTALIQAALNAFGKVRVRRAGGGVVYINGPLVIGSDTHLEIADDVTIKLDGADARFLINAAHGTANRALTSVSITSGAATVTRTGAFTSADIGRTIVIAAGGVGALGVGTGPLVGLITAVPDANTATIDQVALNTVSGGTATVFDRDHNIKVTGGTWDREANSGALLAANAILFRHVDGLQLFDLAMRSTAGKYAISIGDCTEIRAHGLDFDVDSDGIHLTGPINGVNIFAITGSCGDDVVALMTGDSDTVDDDVQGAVSNVLVQGVHASSGTNLVKFLGGGYPFSKATARSIIGTPLRSGVTVADDPLYGIGASNFSGITIDDIAVVVGSASVPAVNISAGAGKDICISNIHLMPTYTAPVLAVSAASGSVWDDVIIDSVTASGDLGASSFVMTIGSTANIKNLTLGSLSLISASNHGGIVNVQGTVGRMCIDKVTADNLATAIVVGSGATCGTITVDASLKNCAFAQCASSVEFILKGLKIDSPAAAYLIGSGSSTVVTLRGDGFTATARDYWRNSGFVAPGNTGPKLKNHVRNWPLVVNPATVASHLVSAGTSPVWGAGNDLRNSVVLGSGASGAASVVFDTVFSSAPFVTMTPVGGVDGYISAVSTTGFTVTGLTGTGFHFALEHVD